MFSTKPKSSSKSHHSSSKAKKAQQSSQLTTSFLFQINELPINDDPNQGGVAPRANDNGRWIPPIYSNGFSPQIPGRLYRWTDGTISTATDCQWYNGEWWSRSGDTLEIYRTQTMFYCNPWAHFMTATGDASTRDMALSADPHNRWWPLTFRHNGTLSRVEEVGEEQYLAGTGATFIADFGLGAYNNRRAPASGGLAGNLATLVALIAFSCQPDQLDNVLIRDRAWRRHRWRGHDRPDGREDQRGVVAIIYLDPENPDGSTASEEGTLYSLEWAGDALIQ